MFSSTFGLLRFSLRLSLVILVLALFFIHNCDSHGRLIEPPSRASAWRYGFQTPPDYNDHELYCGGFQRQWKRNGGKCGECGDAWDLSEPRPHENGGQWGQGVIVRSYLPGSEFTIRVELTASHMGYFEFRLCPEPNAKQPCLDKHLLKLLGGSPAQPSPTDKDFRFYPRNGSRIYEIKALLPDMLCDQCVLQWRYIAGNNWGMCDDGIGAVGCGPQEEFRSCSDIALTTDARTPIRPFRPTIRTTLRPTQHSTSTENAQDSSGYEMSDHMTWITCIVIVLLVLCALGIWFFYRQNKSKIDKWIESVSQRFCKKEKKNSSLVGTAPNKILSPFVAEKISEKLSEKSYSNMPNISPEEPPVPPPRTKRLSRVKDIAADDSSIA